MQEGCHTCQKAIKKECAGRGCTRLPIQRTCQLLQALRVLCDRPHFLLCVCNVESSRVSGLTRSRRPKYERVSASHLYRLGCRDQGDRVVWAGHPPQLLHAADARHSSSDHHVSHRCRCIQGFSCPPGDSAWAVKGWTASAKAQPPYRRQGEGRNRNRWRMAEIYRRVAVSALTSPATCKTFATCFRPIHDAMTSRGSREARQRSGVRPCAAAQGEWCATRARWFATHVQYSTPCHKPAPFPLLTATCSTGR